MRVVEAAIYNQPMSHAGRQSLPKVCCRLSGSMKDREGALRESSMGDGCGRRASCSLGELELPVGELELELRTR